MADVDPSRVLGGAIFNALKDDATVGTLIADRVYDRVPASPVFPYVTVNVDDVTEDDDGCGKHWIAAVSVHAWSRSGNRREAFQINSAVRTALDAVTSAAGYRLNYAQFRQARMLDDPDGLTSHGVVVYEYSLAAT